MNGRTPPDRTRPGAAAAPAEDDASLVEAAQGGDQLAFERLLRRHQGLLDAQASRFYLPGGDQDDVAQEARIGFMKAVRFYRGGRGSSFRTFAELCVSRQLAGAIATARRAKHQPLNEAARGDQAERTLAAVPDRADPLDQLVARDRPRDLVRQASEFSELERNTVEHVLAGLVDRGSRHAARTTAPEHRQCPETGETKAPRVAGALGGVSAYVGVQARGQRGRARRCGRVSPLVR